MSGYLTFEARIEPVRWGSATYTVLRLPKDVAEALATEGAKRVEGEINDHPVNLALACAPVMDGMFLWTGRSLLRRIGAAPGEPLEVRLRKVPEDSVETPEDIALALRSADLTGRWQRLTPGRRRGLLHKIATAKRAETRAKRIAGLIADLQRGAA
ncbi:MAG: YdeI/OmpD-associated family protein [Rhodobacter sp.]|nr:YdeI/OmpD-associated family protein [Rhodobacter sp.]